MRTKHFPLKLAKRESTLPIDPFDYLRIMVSHEAITWLQWVNNNICSNIETDDYKTINVKLRIATGMLNNIKSLTDEEKIQIHSNLTRNVHEEIYLIQTSQLPF